MKLKKKISKRPFVCAGGGGVNKKGKLKQIAISNSNGMDSNGNQ